MSNNIYKLFIIINNYYNKYINNNNINKSELEITYNSNYLLNEAERKELITLIDDIFATEITNHEAVVELLEEHRRRCLAGDIARIALDVEDGKTSIDELNKIFGEFEHSQIEADEAKVVEMDLASLYDTQVKTPGLRWRLNFLNQSLGSLRKGDFGFIFARPETGKTTFLASEISHMVQQTEGDIIWFNNEEQGNTSVGPTVFAADSIEIKPVKLLLEHDRTRPIGKMVSHNVTSSGIEATFKIANTNKPINGRMSLTIASTHGYDGLPPPASFITLKNSKSICFI